MIKLVLAALLAGAVPDGALTIKVGDMTVAMDSTAAWNINAVTYGGNRLIFPSGGRGATLSIGGEWYGGGMRANSETVSSLKVTVDGQETEVKPPQTLSGEKVTVAKQSTMATIAHTAETTFEKDLFIQRHTFEALENTNLGTFYAFIYSTWPQAKNWIAQPLSGQLVRGEFDAKGANKPGCPVRWMAKYDPANGTGLVAYFVESFSGSGAFQAFWDREQYQKLLAQPMKGTLAKGGKVDLTMVVQFLKAAPTEWEQKAQEAAKAMETRFPPQQGAATPPAPKVYGAGVPEDGLLTLKTAHYTVPMSAKQAWTIYKIEYDGNTVAHERGFYGTVMVPVGSNWWGTGHTEGGREIVHSVKLQVDGEDQPLEMEKTFNGSKLNVAKESTIWKFKCNSDVEVTDNHIYERTRLEALEDVDLKLLYYFMHCFVPTTKTWAAELPNGTFEEGPLESAGGFKVNKDTRWVAQYEPTFQYGLLCYTPQVITGPGSRAMIWDLSPERYHKFYYQQNTGQSFKKGDVLDYSVIAKVVPGESGDWTATKTAAETLKGQYPPK